MQLRVFVVFACACEVCTGDHTPHSTKHKKKQEVKEEEEVKEEKVHNPVIDEKSMWVGERSVYGKWGDREREREIGGKAGEPGESGAVEERTNKKSKRG